MVTVSHRSISNGDARLEVAIRRNGLVHRFINTFWDCLGRLGRMDYWKQEMSVTRARMKSE